MDGNADIYIHSLASAKTTSLPLPKGVNALGGAESAFTQDGSRLLYYHNGPNAPNDAWIYNLRDSSSHQVTHALLAGIPTDHMIEPQLVHYPSRDRKWTISAWLYVPHNMQRNGKNAAIVYVHGGPTAQTVNSFNRFVQHMANQGYMVLDVRSDGEFYDTVSMSEGLNLGHIKDAKHIDIRQLPQQWRELLASCPSPRACR